MKRPKHLSILAKFLIAFSVVPLMIVGFTSAPPPMRSGAPGEESCWTARCHMTDSGTLFEDSDSVAIHFPGGPTYQPGVPQMLRLDINDPMGVVFGFQLSARDGENGQAGNLASLDASTSVNTAGGVQYLGHNITPKAEGTFDFEWTPPSADVGKIMMYVAGNAANGNHGITGNRIHLKAFEVDAAAPPGVPSINDGGAVQSTTFSADQGFSSNTFGTVFGSELTDVTLTWDSAFVDGVAPTSLGGAQVLYNGEPAFISFVGNSDDLGSVSDQINFVAPATEAAGQVTIEVVTSGGRSAPAVVMHQALSPTFFPIGPLDRSPQAMAAVHTDGTLVGPANLFGPGVRIRPAVADDVISLFGTGFGRTMPPVPVGTIPGGFLAPGITSSTVEDVRICFGDVEVEPLFAGLSGFVGVYQIVVRVPPGLPSGDVLVAAKIGGVRSQDGISIRVAVP